MLTSAQHKSCTGSPNMCDDTADLTLTLSLSSFFHCPFFPLEVVWFSTVTGYTVVLKSVGHRGAASVSWRIFSSAFHYPLCVFLRSRKDSLESESSAAIIPHELVRTRQLESVHLKFNQESGTLLPLCLRYHVSSIPYIYWFRLQLTQSF